MMKQISQHLKSVRWILLLLVVWSAGIIWTFGRASLFEFGRGDSGQVSENWMITCPDLMREGKPLLITFIHPQCSCSASTLDSLAKVLAQTQQRLNAVAVFEHPAGVDADWCQTGLWEAANRIPGLRVIDDKDQHFINAFDAKTSGETLLFDRAGKEVFHGGLTPSRAHQGSCAGTAAVLQFAFGKPMTVSRSPVFGCPLAGSFKSTTAEQTP